jgi:hypothetical protein
MRKESAKANRIRISEESSFFAIENYGTGSMPPG